MLNKMDLYFDGDNWLKLYPDTVKLKLLNGKLTYLPDPYKCLKQRVLVSFLTSKNCLTDVESPLARETRICINT